jgi:hypothetical protein
MYFKQLSIGLVLLLSCTRIIGQIDLQLNYSYSEDLNKTISSKIALQFPNRKTANLYADTLKSFELLKADYLSIPGSYLLTIYFSDNNTIRDSIDYGIVIDGKETDIEIDISFHYNERLQKVNNQWIKKEKIPKGYISVRKYFQPPESIKISLSNLESNDSFQGPFFRLVNNSRDTLYGEYLPGYFWGSLYISTNDSTWSRKKIGIIDTEFVDSPPLLPDSIKIATVGSFGAYYKLPKCSYKYELLLSNTSTHGLTKHIDNDCMEWWATTENFYRLIYKFKIE